VFYFVRFVVKTFVAQIIQILPQQTQRGHKSLKADLLFNQMPSKKNGC